MAHPTGTFSWPRFIVSAYGPTLFSMIGYGAVLPLIALSALRMGASVPLSALITSFSSVGTICGDLPASWLTVRLGERRAIALACIWDAAWMATAFFAHNLVVLSVAIFAVGLSAAVFGLARQSYITEMVPVKFRARALSSLGGTFRIGMFIGPVAGSGIIAVWDLRTAYGFAALMSLVAAGVTMLLPDLPEETQGRRGGSKTGPRLFAVLRAHLRVLATLGTGIMFLGMIRAARQTVLPLWCESLGLDASHTSLVYAASMAVDMSLFFVGGFIMDRFGRAWVVVPSMIILGLGLAGLAIAHTVPVVIVAAVVLGFGNGIGSGVIMTLGSDASPDVGRAQFLSGWRLLGDSGGAVGPVLLSAITALASLAVATVAMGAVSVFGAAWLGYWIRRSDADSVHPPAES